MVIRTVILDGKKTLIRAIEREFDEADEIVPCSYYAVNHIVARYGIGIGLVAILRAHQISA